MLPSTSSARLQPEGARGIAERGFVHPDLPTLGRPFFKFFTFAVETLPPSPF